MGKIILNNIEYGTGTPNSSNVDTTNLVKKDNIVTTLDDTVTDEQIPSAKVVHTAIQNLSVGVPADVYSKTEVDDLLADKADSTDIIDSYTKDEVDNLLNGKVNTDDLVDSYSKTEVDTLLTGKADSTDIIDAYSKTEVDNLLANKADSSAIEEAKTDLENEIANIPKVTKTSELTNDSGFITASDIPTTLPASDVYAWAKEATKPTYTASEVGALASNGTATNASKVANALTLQVNGVTNLTYDGSSARTFNLANASTSISGVMTPAMVTKLDGIATGATKNVVDTAMSSTSTNAVQNKVIYAYIQEQLKNVVKSAGDYMGKTMINVSTDVVGTSNGYTYTNSKGGFADLMFTSDRDNNPKFELIVDGVTIMKNAVPMTDLKQIVESQYAYELKIPFTSTFTVKHYVSSDYNSHLQGFIYVNK